MRRSAAQMLMFFAAAALALTAACGTTAQPGEQTAPTGQVPSGPLATSSTPSSPAQSPSAPATTSASPPTSASPSAAPSTPAASTPTQVLSVGMSGPQVRLLQQRLAALKYYPGAADGQFGTDTLEAVWAFQEVQGLTPSNEVSHAMLAALANPHKPAVLVPGGPSTRVEISLRREVLVLYRGGQVALISHVSTGGGYYYCSPAGGCGYAITPTGDFHTLSFVPGWLQVPLGEMYNSVFFLGTAFAIHGDTYVPLLPASHGCVRIPMDIAAFFHTLVAVPGTAVYIRH
jgi:hypothetical protein